MPIVLSVVMPVHNSARYLPRTLESIEASIQFLNAHHPDRQSVAIEVIAVDDASTDDSVAILQAWAKGHPNYLLQSHDANRGAGPARNTGVRAAQGEILFFCDSDDLFLPEHLLIGASALMGTPLPSMLSGLAMPTEPVGVVKTGVRVKDFIHPYWKLAIENTSPLNLCIQRKCHDFLEGYPEDPLYRSIGCEDVTYQVMLNQFFRIHKVERETVEYLRYPGNNLDRQLAKFQSRPNAPMPAVPDEERQRQQQRLALEERRLHALIEKWCVFRVSPFPCSYLHWPQLAKALWHHRQPEQALRILAQAKQIDPQQAMQLEKELRPVPGTVPEGGDVDLVDSAVELARNRNVAKAIELFREAIRRDPSNARAHHNLGVAFAQSGRGDEAISCFTEALRLHPDYVDVHYNLGNVLQQKQQWTESAAAYRRALELKPDHADSLNNLGLVLLELKEIDEALIVQEQAVRLRPDFAESLNNLALVHTELGDFEKAHGLLDQTLKLRPLHAEAHGNMGNNYKEAGDLGKALACYRMALTIDPESPSIHWNRALAWLQQGNYELGFREYEWRLRKPNSGVLSFQKPTWDGSPLRGRTILLHLEQGWGDMIQFVRYASVVKAQGARVLLFCPQRLKALLSRCPAIDQVVEDGEPIPDFDVHSSVMSLPAILGTTLATIPASAPYLFADPALMEKWRSRIETLPGLKIGIAWQGNPKHKGDRHRSFPLSELEPLLELPGTSFVCLQKGTGKEQQRALSNSHRILDPGDDIDEGGGAFTDTAAILSHLDLVISCDTALVHLAGAMGIPTWVLVSHRADWRWLCHREDTPWYPDMRLFRKQPNEEWRHVIRRVKELLESKLGRLSAERSPQSDDDYVSPGLVSIRPDRFFPNMTIGNKAACQWPHLRREVPHFWYVDRRAPLVGFLSRDEAAILYNTALRFRGKRALEIGCWMGWSACHLALAGVQLDVIDPIIDRPGCAESIRQSLSDAGVLYSVNLVSGTSPEKVHELARQHDRRWALIFVDGDHEHPAPLVDVQTCVKYADADALILLHDVASPDVGRAVHWLRDNGWHVRIYQTMQIMAAAWRGDIQPIEHQPDARVSWNVPRHLNA